MVTNRHVVDGAVKANFRFHTATEEGAPIPSQNVAISMGNFEQAWYPHPDPKIDLVAIPTGALTEEIQRRGFEAFFFGISSSLVPSQEQLDHLTPVEDLLMVGYPIGLYDEVNNFPLIRRGITATHPKLNYNGRPEVMIDAACFPGSSGSPVFLWYPAGRPKLIEGIEVPAIIKFLGVLRAGPMYTADGRLEIVDVPTQQQFLTRSQIPTNLGIVLKSRLVLDFEDIIEKAIGASRGGVI